MKKAIVVFALLVGAVVTVQAQKFHVGIKGGVNFANFTGDVPNNLDGKTGFHFGAIAELGVSEKFSIQPEAIYSSQGAKLSDIDLNVDYINVPVLAKLYVIDNLSLQAGPQFGFVINDKNIEDPKAFDLSGAVGAEVTFGKFFAQARYNIGFSDIADNEDVKNSVFQLSVGIKIL